MGQLTEMTIDNLGNFDGGRIRLAFAQSLLAIVNDLQNRPADGTARTLTLTLRVIPSQQASGLMESGELDVTVNTSIPKKKSAPARVLIKPNGKLVFNAESPDDPHQSTFAEGMREGEQLDPKTGEVVPKATNGNPQQQRS